MLLVIPVATKIFYPIYHEMKLTSCYEYLGVRFGKEMRLMGATLYVIQMCFYTSVSVLAPAIALSKATGLNTRLAIILIYVVCVFYSSQGGLKAVIIADTFQVGERRLARVALILIAIFRSSFQSCVLFVSMILIVSFGTVYQGRGIWEIYEVAKEHDRIEFWK
jgi:solute carrier family 5 (sodium-coupled monocarboxylate transporter), member 8/12